MSPQPDEVKRLLRSDKVRDRAKGLKDCGVLLLLDKDNVLVTSLEWKQICLAAIQYEQSEIRYAQSKAKPQALENAQFLRRLVKHCVAQSQINSKALPKLFDHSIKLLGDAALPEKYQLEHKQILCSLFELRVAHLLTTSEISSAARYLQDRGMADRRGVIDVTNQKLLRGVARVLFSERDGSVQLAAELVEWMCQGGRLFDKVQGDPTAEASLTMLQADCLSLLIEYHGASLAEVLFRHVRMPLQMVVKLISMTAQTNRDAHRDSCLRFLLTYLHFSAGCHFSLVSPLCAADPVVHLLDKLFEELSCDDCIRTLVLHATNVSMRQNKELFVNVLDDPICRLHFEVAAVSCCLLQLLSGSIASSLRNEAAASEGPAANGGPGLKAAEESGGTPSKRQKLTHLQSQQQQTQTQTQTQTQQSQAHALPAGDGRPSSPAERPVRLLLRKIQGLSATATTQRHARAQQAPKATQAGGRSSQHTMHSQSATQALERQSSAMPVMGRHAASVVYEGTLWLAAALARLFPRGEFLLPDADCARDVLSRSARIVDLCEWVHTLRTKAVEVLAIDELQIHGALLVALRAFARVSSVVLNSQSDCPLPYSFSSDDSAAHAAKLRWEWAEVVRFLLHSPRIRSYCVGCRKLSVAEALYGLFETVIELDLLDPSAAMALQQSLWGMPTMLDPRLVESPASLSLLAALVTLSRLEVVPTLGRVYFQQLLLADNEAMDADDAQRASMAGLLGMDLHGPSLPVAYLACFLDSQLDAPAAARISLAACAEFSLCVARLVYSTRRGDDADRSRDATRIAALSTSLGCSYPVTFQGAGAAIMSNWLERSYSDATEESVCHLLGCNLMLTPGGTVSVDTASQEGQDDALRAIPDLSDPSRRAYRATAQSSIEVLEVLRKRLLSKELMAANLTESAEVSPWQLLLLLVASAYLAVVENMERDMLARSSELALAISSGLAVTERQKFSDSEHAEECFQTALQAMHRFWTVCQAHLKTLMSRGHSAHSKVESNLKRAHHIKTSQLGDYMHMWMAIFRRATACRLFHFDVQGIASAHSSAPSSASSTASSSSGGATFGAYETTLRPNVLFSPEQTRDINSVRQVRMDCAAELLALCKIVRDLATSQPAPGGGGRDDLDDMDVAQPRAPPPMRREDDDDDDDDMGTWDDNGRPVAGNKSKVTFSQDQLRLFVSLANCYMVSITADVREHIYEDRLDLLLRVLQEREIGGAIVPVCTPSDSALAVAESLSATLAASFSDVSCTPLSRYFLEFSWDIEWGNVGFYKVLCVIYDLTRRKQFYLTTMEKDFKRIQTIVSLIFCENETISHFPGSFWRARWLQVECIANLLRFDSSYQVFAQSPAGRAWKDSLTARGVRLFVLAPLDEGSNQDNMSKIRKMLTEYIGDCDARVRAACGRAAVLLLRYLKWRHTSIYSALMDQTGVPVVAEARREGKDKGRGQDRDTGADLGQQVEEGAEEDVWEDPQRVVTSAFSMALFGVHSPVLLPQTLLDLCRLCCSRSSQHRGVAGVPLPCFFSLLSRLLLFMARELGYSSPETMLSDHLRFLMREWTRPPAPPASEADAMDDGPPSAPVVRVTLTLSDFPFHVMRLSSRYLYADFLLERSGAILPMICQVADIGARWRLAQEFAKFSGYGATDQGMAKLFSHFAPAIWGSEYPHAHQLGLLVKDQQGLPETDMSAFLARIVMGESIRARLLIQSASDILQEHVSCYAEMPLEPDNRAPVRLSAPSNCVYAPDAGHWLPSAPLKGVKAHIGLLAEALAAQKTDKRLPLTNDNLMRMLSQTFLHQQVNLVEVLACLRRRVLDTRLEKVRLNVLACLTALARYDVVKKTLTGLMAMRGMVNVALCTVQTTSHHSVVITACRFLAQIAERWGPAYMDNTGLDCLGEFFCDLLGLNAALGSCLNHLAGAEQCGCDDYASAAYRSLVDAARDAGALHKHPTPAARPVSAVQAAQSEQEEWTEEITAARGVLSAAMMILLHSAQDIGLEVRRRGVPINPIMRCLPVPRVFVPSLSENVRLMVADLESSESPFDFTWRMKDFVLLSAQILHGTPISPMLMWCKLLGIHDTLLREEGPHGARDAMAFDAHTEGEQDDEADAKDTSLWTRHPDLVAAFVASMIRLSDTQHSLPAGASAQAALYQQRIMQVLGHLGPPDLLSMQHAGIHGVPHVNSIPASPGDAGHSGSAGDIPSLDPVSDVSSLEFDEGAPTVGARKASLFVLLLGMLWQDSHASAVASAALRLMAANRCFDDADCLEAARLLGARTEINLYRTVPLACRLQAHCPAPKSDVTHGYIPINAPHHGSQSTRGPSSSSSSSSSSSADSEDPWSPALWSTANKTYAGWITRLVPALLRAFCSHAARAFTGPSGGVYLLPDLLDSSNAMDVQTLAAPPTSQPDAQHMTRFLAPLVEACMLRHTVATAVFPLLLLDMLTAGLHQVKEKLSEHMSTHMLSQQCSLAEATRLGCTTLVFLLRQEIQAWHDVPSPSASPKSSKKGKKEAKSPLPGLPGLQRQFPYSYTLDIDYKYAAAAAERSGCVCTALLFAELSEEDRRRCIAPPPAPAVISGPGRDSPRTPQPPSVHASQAPTGRSADLFVRIFRKIHDPDAIMGMVHAATDLEVQALLYAHNGSWVEALGTYESLMAQEGGGGAVGLGESEGRLVVPSAGIAQALRGLGAQHALSAFTSARLSGEDASGPGGADLGAMAGEQGWRGELARGTSAAGFDAMSGNGSGGLGGAGGADGLRAWSPAVLSLAGGGASSSAAHGPSAHTSSLSLLQRSSKTDFFNDCLAQSLADIQRKDLPSAQRRVQACSQRLFPQIAECLAHETAYSLVPDLVRAQQMVELLEAGAVMAGVPLGAGGATAGFGVSGGARSDTEKLLTRWRRRLRSSQSILVHNEALLSLRLSLTSQLLQSRRAQPSEAIGLMLQVQDVGGSRGAAHALSPLVYRLKSVLFAASQAAPSGQGAGQGLSHLTTGLASGDRPLWKVQWAMHEGRLLWNKGLHRVALESLDGVIASIRDSLQAIPSAAASSLASSRAHATPNTSFLDQTARRALLRGLLSEAYNTCVGWVCSRRSATAGDILHEYFLPAVAAAHTDASKIKAALELAGYYERLFQQVRAKLGSSEWMHFLRNNADRLREKGECEQYKQQLNSRLHPGKDSGVPALPAEEHAALEREYQQMSRHLSGLKKELDLDDGERRRVEESVSTFLHGAMKHYADVLALSDQADVEVVFRVVNLWFSNRGDARVNEALDGIVQRAASFKFVPLTYQILSRLGAAPALAAPPSSSYLSSAVPKAGAAAAAGGASAAASGAGVDGSVPSRARGSRSPRTVEATPAPAAAKEVYLTFAKVQQHLVLKLAAEHPHHVLPQLLALINTDPPAGPSTDKRLGSTQMTQPAPRNARVEAASLILAALRTGPGSSAHLRELIDSVDVMLKAYITLAGAPVPKAMMDNKQSDISFSSLQGRGAAFDQTWCVDHAAASSSSSSSSSSSAGSTRPAVLTLSLPVSPTGDYSACPRVRKFRNRLTLTDSGLSRPKIILCEADDGRAYKQLVKGGDDMRQDAVMQQVFENVNYTLARVEETRKRVLHIRTYKIVPLTPQTGVIEYVQNTEPFGHYLLHGDHAAHERYYPQDWTCQECRAHMTAGVDASDREARFLEVMARFHPVFRFYLLEKYPDPAQWVNCRRAYTQSVAVNSFVGYVLGIGDRHVHNIMIDSQTAEVVHIDFGIVFEQGKILQTPETVPFRLTRDVVDGMGATGTEGTFRRASEEVLRVLRDNTLQLMTILEVVLHDPLYKWSLSPLQARAKQADGQGQAQAPGHGQGHGGPSGDTIVGTDNTLRGTLSRTPLAEGSDRPDRDAQGVGLGSARDAAERTLLRIKSKLQGFEDPSGESLGVEGQVDLVIQSAKDPRNLAKLFPGWNAWV